MHAACMHMIQNMHDVHAWMQALMAPKKNDKELAHSNSVLNKQNIFRHLENTNYTF